MPKTVRGIYHNLRESKYTASNTEVVFFFSSKLYLNKFMNGYRENRRKMNKRFNVGNDIPLNFNTLSDILFYEEVEKRGFFVRLKLSPVSFDDLYKYALRKMNEKETLDWCVVDGKKEATIYATKQKTKIGGEFVQP
ncbi:MAG: transcriptional regulator [Ignavibacteria bacterium]|jgi:hypothetical protein|nr:transcriptional regulator [Ignavibacteria bacterium]